MRLFVGIRFDEPVNRYLKTVSEYAITHASSGKTTAYEHFHLTLTFIGELPGYRLDELIQALDDHLENTRAFRVRFHDMGSFIRNQEHTVWIGVIDKDKTLLTLNKRVCEALDDVNVDYDKKRFFPHITLARRVIFGEISIPLTIPYYSKDVWIRNITLFKSHRHLDQLIYTPIHNITLLDG